MKFLFSDDDTAYYQAEESDVPEEFESSVGEFTDYYRMDSLQDMRDRLVRMYVTKRGGRVVGYVTLAMAHIGPDATEEIRKKEVNVNIPALLISHLAVHKDFLRRGIGTSLLDLVFLVVPKLEPWAGCRYVILNPRDDQGVRDFYVKYGFTYEPNFKGDMENDACLLNLKSRRWVSS